MTLLAEEMLVDINVLVLSRSFKIQDVIRRVLLSLLPLISGSGAELHRAAMGRE